MEIKIPEFSLVVMIGVSGSGKSSFAAKYFKPAEIISSDFCRSIVSNDENDQSSTDDAFALLHYMVSIRLKNGLLTVIDATNVQQEARKKLIGLARSFHCLPVAIVLDLKTEICQERNKNRSDRDFGEHVIRMQKQQLNRSIRNLREEGFRNTVILKSVEEIDSVTGIVREKLYNNKKDEHGPFDIIGDVHGCYRELKQLLFQLGYQIIQVPENENNFGTEIIPPAGRKLIFLGDLTDRGPDSPAVLRLVMSAVNSGNALCVPGNHDMKLLKYLNGRNVQLKHGLELTAQQLEKESSAFKNTVKEFLDALISHYVLDNGKLVVAHAGLREDMQGRGSGAVRTFCYYGETTGEIDEFGLPVRYNWARDYRGKAKVVYGHTPVPEAEWLNKTIDIDTGCVFGGKLTALRYPEEELVSVDAEEIYCEPVRPIGFNSSVSGLTSQQLYDDLLDIGEVIGKRIIQTRLKHNLTIREENAIAALEVMSRFAINPKWLIYLPPTMAPCATSEIPELLEHPYQALQYYKKNGVRKLICEQKHMGSRAVIIVCRDKTVPLKRFGIESDKTGVCYTRTGRSFFSEENIEREFIQRIQNALTKNNFWDDQHTDWVCLDAELMPWSEKARALLTDQYASVGAAAQVSLSMAEEALNMAVGSGLDDAIPFLNEIQIKETAVEKYIKAYQQYCWPVHDLDDYKLAPFHILATEGKVHSDKDHVWHMETIASFCKEDLKLLLPTPYKFVDFTDENAEQSVIDWWTQLTVNGGEGMVVKPFDFIAHGEEGLLQPAVKCRGSEYLRIIYGPEYDMPQNISRLKSRALGRKQSLALREFALGIESLERFVRKEPLRLIHEAVFAVLALESEPVDPRL